MGRVWAFMFGRWVILGHIGLEIGYFWIVIKDEIFIVGSFQLFKLNNHMFCFGISGLIRRGIHKCH